MNRCFVTDKLITDLSKSWFCCEFDSYILFESMDIVKERCWDVKDLEAKCIWNEYRDRFNLGD
jgi:hypothetical protein